ncbi:hypothetical protein QU755_08795, partial [Pseudomonas wenzhouensis]
GFLLCAEFSANYMIFIGKFLKLMTLALQLLLHQRQGHRLPLLEVAAVMHGHSLQGQDLITGLSQEGGQRLWVCCPLSQDTLRPPVGQLRSI